MPGISDRAKVQRSAVSIVETRERRSSRARARTVSTGPTTAPAWSMARWNPNALPRIAGSTWAAIRESRGEVRMPLPMRSTRRTSTICQAWPTAAVSGRKAEESE